MGFTIKEYVGYDMLKEVRKAVNKCGNNNKKKPAKKTSATKKNNGSTKKSTK
mgnify:FL=1